MPESFYPYPDGEPFVKFTGQYSDLTPSEGWRLNQWSAYEEKNRCYEQRVSEKHDQFICVWQPCGGYVEFHDFMEHSYLFMQFLLDEAIAQKLTWEYDRELFPGSGKDRDTYEFFINIRDGYVVCPNNFVDYPNFHLHSLSLADDERAALQKAYYEEWRSVLIKKDFYDACLEFIRNGMAEIITP